MQQLLTFVDRNNKKLSLRKQCYLLGINRSVIYYHPQEAEEDIWLMNLIRDIWLKHSFYGYRKITVVINKEYGLSINGKKILRLMRLCGIQAIYPKPRLSRSDPIAQKYPYLLRNIVIKRVNQVWMVDITYLKLCTRFVYLVALIDVYSRYVIGWHLSFELDTENCMDALKMALGNGLPEIVNSDQGCQFTSDKWIETLADLKIKISMDGKGRYQDNIYIERFWRTIKYEAIYLNEYSNFQELYLGVKQYIIFYNEQRPHQSLNYKTPEDIYTEKYNNSKIKSLNYSVKNLLLGSTFWMSKQLAKLKLIKGVDSL